MSLNNVTHLVLENIPSLQATAAAAYFARCGNIQESQVLLDVARVRPDSLSRLRGVDVSLTIDSCDGTEYLCIPVRRG